MEIYGRAEIYTDVGIITRDNVSDVVKKAMEIHEANAKKIEFLLGYEAGNQPILRTKTYRKDIDCKCVDNVANEIAEFKQSYNWGNPITFVMKDKAENADNDVLKGVSEINKCYEAQDYRSKQQELARYVEICGVGYTYVDINTDYEDGESPFTIDVLNPECAFVVKSSTHPDKRVLLGVTYYCGSDGKKRYTCFSKDSRYELNNEFEHLKRSGEANPLSMVPITKWIRSHDNMGCFERQISEMDNLNLLISDFTNDVEQNTQAIWHTNDVEFPVVEVKNEDGTTDKKVVKPKGNDWMQTYTSPDGKTPFVKPLSIDYDYAGMLNNILSRRALILQKCNVPSRNDNSGGSTGVAMSDATGWTQAETEASRQDQIRESCKMNELRIVLKAINKCPGLEIGSPLRKLKPMDLQVNIKRQKTY
ncbi:MAG: phage portal protein, partial [Bacteroidales bacterium]|nr:phage portal protein [Bacteroidales bacterium]